VAAHHNLVDIVLVGVGDNLSVGFARRGLDFVRDI
jgi:hypothetical protein